MSNLAEQVAEKLSNLPFEKQKTVLDFVEFLSKEQKSKNPSDSSNPSDLSKPSTFYEDVVSKHVGCVDSGHTDLATNKAHMESFGKV